MMGLTVVVVVVVSSLLTKTEEGCFLFVPGRTEVGSMAADDRSVSNSVVKRLLMEEPHIFVLFLPDAWKMPLLFECWLEGGRLPPLRLSRNMPTSGTDVVVVWCLVGCC